MPRSPAPENAPPVGAKELYRRYGASLVAVVGCNKKGDEGIGAAFHVGDGVFVTARHVVDGMAELRVTLDGYRIQRLAEDALEDLRFDYSPIPIAPVYHPDPAVDVAAFKVAKLAGLPAIPLGGHLDDWITDHDFVLNEVLVLGFPPVPLSIKPVLVASRAQISAVIDLINIRHVHFVVSAMARGGFSGGVVLSEWGVAMGIVTSSLLKNDLPEELGYLTVLSVEPILECLGANELMPQELSLFWDGLFSAETEHFGKAELKLAHSYITAFRDGYRARISFATPRPEVATGAVEAIRSLPGISTRYECVPKDVHVWEIVAEYQMTLAPFELVVGTLRSHLLSHGYDFVENPMTVDRSIDHT